MPIGRPGRDCGPETVFRHLDYLVQMIGPGHVAFGLDYMSPELCAQVLRSIKGDLSKVGMSEPPWGYLHPGALVEVVELMVSNGYSEDAVSDILGRNVIKLAKRVWK